MKTSHVIVLCCLSIILFAAAVVPAAENCALMGGKCRGTCLAGEEPAIGSSLDCGDKAECCTAGSAAEPPTQCCIYSYDKAKSGSSNCGPAEHGACAKGAGSPAPCGKLPLCR
ncbi:MAG: hypothetical protein L7F78_24065 [Syntrophales bacterium LBB04]|nr:hypothetical protein [Syntrophales bacterium LBB04]